jgi:cold shock CspA family protein
MSIHHSSPGTDHLHGSIKCFNALQRHGLLAPADGSEDVFFHSSNVFSGQREIQPGAEVTFNVKHSRHIRWAEHIKIVSPKTTAPELKHRTD